MSSTSPLLIGIDTGGTFTDLIAYHDGSIWVHKLLSTPDDPSRAILSGVQFFLEELKPLEFEVIHGTTVATNALLERRGARVAFLTTAGFEDLLFLARQDRPELYDLEVRREPPPLQRIDCLGVNERLNAKGEVLRILSEEVITRVLDELRERDVEAVVISFLHSYANPSHEVALKEALLEEKRWHLTASHEVTPTFREYERSATALINGYVGPVMKAYLERLQAGLAQARSIEILQSHGGRTDPVSAGELPVHTVLSGPAGGVVGALHAAREVGIDKIITFDMGGTSTDVSLAMGAPTITEESEIGGLPLQVPVIDIFTVGAGGGSIAYVDPGGALRVGPRSAGASPGPVAYGEGGSEPTVTDAHVALGSLPAAHFLGGSMQLDRKSAREAVALLGKKIGLSWEETARGILSIADATMARAIKVVSLERGEDPRDLAMVSFGGAGGLHACRLAEFLEISKVIIPRFPGLLSAMGMLQSERKRLYSHTYFLSLPSREEEKKPFYELIRGMEARAEEELGTPVFSWSFSVRYEGQSFSLRLQASWEDEGIDWDQLRDDFEKEHLKRYGYVDLRRSLQLVGLRLEARVPRSPLEVGDVSFREQKAQARESIDLGRGEEDVQILSRGMLNEGQCYSGPMIITEYSGTTILLKGWELVVEAGHLLLSRKESAQKDGIQSEGTL